MRKLKMDEVEDEGEEDGEGEGGGLQEEIEVTAISERTKNEITPIGR